MARNIKTEVVRQFKGMDCWHSVDLVRPDYAIDCLNVIVSGTGGLEKLRYPVTLSPAATANLIGPGNVVNFQNAAGVRQLLAMFNGYLYRIDLVTWTATLVEYNTLNTGVISSVVANNLAFIANGQRMMKWSGTAYQNWGIQQPGNPQITITSLGGLTNPTIGPTLDYIEAPPETIPYITIPARSFTVSYTWVLGTGETQESPPTSISLAADNWLLVTVPALPATASGFKLYIDPTGGANRHYTPIPDYDQPGNPANDLINQLYESGYSYVEPWPIALYWDAAGIDPPGANTTNTGTQALSIGRRYRVAYGNSVTGHVGAASNMSNSTGVITSADQINVELPNPMDTQCDRIFVFSTMDGGGDYYLYENPNSSDGAWDITAGVDSTTIVDTLTDDQLNKAVIAPLLNFAPPVGRFVCEWGGRIFVARLDGALQDIAYSGYERIYLGRPEESFPPNNRLRLAIGADELAGIGVIQAGVVAFSISNEMFMFRGTVTDRSTDAPVEYLAELEKLPWNTGCASHYSIARTPYGLVWLDSGKTLLIFNGIDAPRELGGSILPILRRISQGQESDCRGVFYSFLDREWYLLLCALDDSTTKNHIIVVDLNPNADENVGAFPLAVAADAMEVVEDVNGNSHLIIMQSGYAKELIINSDTTGGISLEYEATANEVPAYWRGGYFGGDSPHIMKMFRYGRLVTDQIGFSLQHYLVDGDFRNPDTIPFAQVLNNFAVNRKSRRMSTEIQFPVEDVAANVIELSVSHIKTSDR